MTVTAINSSKEPSILRGMAMRLNAIISRAQLSGMFGTAFGGKRDYYDAFAWDRTINPDNIWMMYNRGGIAKRVVDAFPDAIWGRAPQLYIQGNATWNSNWDKFVRDYKLWSVFRRLDRMAALGRYSCLLIGTNKGALERPQPKGASITYLQPYAEKDMKVHTFDTNPMSPRFGRPETYTVYPQKVEQITQGVTAVAPVRQSFVVHWSRVLHLTRDPMENDDFSIPLYAPIWNYLTDLQKVVGSSSESYWINSNPGLHADIDKEMDLDPEDEAALTAEVDEYMNNVRRFVRTRGVKVDKISGSVADPKGPFDVLLTLISGTTGIPKRILLGSEAGQLASTQDKGNWAERIEEQRSNHSEPFLVLPFMLWLKNNEVMDVDMENVQVLWPEAYRMSPLERSQQSAQVARTLANIQKGLQPIVLTPGTPAITNIDGTVTPGTPDVTTDPILSRDEARKLLGLSTDQNLVTETPE